MKRSELKQLIKPIVEECIKDALLTSGLLTSVISEVVAGVQKGLVVEQTQPQPQQIQQPVVQEQKNTISEEEKRKILENKKKLLDAIGTSSYNGVDVFEGTKPLKKGGAPSKSSGGYKAFEGIDPNDPGVNIDKLTNNLGGIWKKLAEGKK